MNWKCLFFLGMFWAQSSVFAQSADADTLKSRVEIKTSDGNIHRGTVKKEEPSSITILREDGLEMEIPKYVIVYKRDVSSKSTPSRATEHASRYLYSPSAFPINKGEGYINLLYFSVVQAQYGLTDNLSIGITSTAILMPTLLNAKYSVKINDKLHFSVGGQFGKLWFADEETLGIGFANMTYGDKKENITLNAGYGFYTGMDEQLPIFSGCYAKETSEKVAFIAEFWAMFPRSEGPVYVGGPAMRIKVGKNLFFDVGVLGLSFTSTGQYYNADNGTYEFRRERETYTPLPFLGLNWGL